LAAFLLQPDVMSQKAPVFQRKLKPEKNTKNVEKKMLKCLDNTLNISIFTDLNS